MSAQKPPHFSTPAPKHRYTNFFSRRNASICNPYSASFLIPLSVLHLCPSVANCCLRPSWLPGFLIDMHLRFWTLQAVLPPLDHHRFHRFRTVYSPFSAGSFAIFHPFITVFTVSDAFFPQADLSKQMPPRQEL